MVFMMKETECAPAADALECLCLIPSQAITAAMDKTPTFLSFQVHLVVMFEDHLH